MNKFLIALVAAAFAGSVMAADEPQSPAPQEEAAEKPASAPAPATPATDEDKPADAPAAPASAAE